MGLEKLSSKKSGFNSYKTLYSMVLYDCKNHNLQGIA